MGDQQVCQRHENCGLTEFDCRLAEQTNKAGGGAYERPPNPGMCSRCGWVEGVKGPHRHRWLGWGKAVPREDQYRPPLREYVLAVAYAVVFALVVTAGSLLAARGVGAVLS